MAEPRRYPEGVTCWIDVQQPDLEAARAFYAGLFGWAFQDATPAWNGTRYLVAQLDGHAVAGLTSGASAWNTYVAVDDADEVARRIGAVGGRVLHRPTAAAEGGRYAVCADPSGVPFRLWQAGTLPGAQTVNAPGAWNFSDLHARDPEASAAFYADVFGWAFDDVGFGTMIRRPGYGDHLAATVDPDIHDHDATAAAAESLGGTVLNRGDTEWTRDALLRDPQGALFTVSQFTPPTQPG